ncbi:uncharacterized protein BXIN_1272 [Babesia sp. Xinjiang]|uniref:uncharacterized protein n=1 Tax=Babesia sp. Xinjiang TaxID=462227 RepID=UPI000A227881|nr:uncharacterized protein BXIN_1272 [Babesia sp. Xinjiang]ORM40022.1 hypothetical protein BXIN_1272 [Babesia sp. Xinjiang]
MAYVAERRAARANSGSLASFVSADGWVDSVADAVEGSDHSERYYYTQKAARATFPDSYASIPAEDTVEGIGIPSFSRRGYVLSDTSDMSETSVVDHDIALLGPSMMPVSDSISRRMPRKIIITLRASDLLRYPLLRLSHCISVLRFQRSLVDVHAASDGIYRNMTILPNLFTLTSPSGFAFASDLVKSVWRRYGWMGFYRGFMEYVAHRLLCDVMRFVVPRYIAPSVNAVGMSICRRALLLEPESLRRLRNLCFGEGLIDADNVSKWKSSSINDFIERNFDFDGHVFLTEVLVEAFTYPALTVSSRMMIYDGPYPLNALSLLKGTLACDGMSSLYQGFIWRLVSLIFEHLHRRHERRGRHLMFALDGRRTPLDQSVPFFLTVGSTVFQQISLVQRCMSSMDGFCAESSSMSLLSHFPWLAISTQMALTVCLMHLKDRIME